VTPRQTPRPELTPRPTPRPEVTPRPTPVPPGRAHAQTPPGSLPVQPELTPRPTPAPSGRAHTQTPPGPLLAQPGELARAHAQTPPGSLPVLAEVPSSWAYSMSAPEGSGSGRHASLSGAGAGAGRQSAPSLGPYPQASSGLHAASASGATDDVVGAQVATPEVGAEKPARGWPMLVVILAAMVIGSLAVLLVMKMGGSSRAGAPIAHEAVPLAGGTGTVSASAAAGSAGSAAGPSTTPIDAAAAAPVNVQAAGDGSAPAAPATGDGSAPAAPAAAPPETPRTPLEAAMDEQRYTDAAALCAKQITPETAVMCTLAACHARLDAKARTWFLRAPPGERTRLTGLCRSLGVNPVTRRPAAPPPKKQAAPEEKCEGDPEDCPD
jgi:hypothetical protein